ncbi:MAG: CopD family protein [Rhizobiaceae bacterium]
MFGALTSWDFAAIAVKFFVYGGSFLAIGSTLFILANRGLDKNIDHPLRKLILWAVLTALTASALQFGVQSGRLLDEGLGGMLDWEMMELVKNAPLGNAIFYRVLGLVLLLAFAFAIPVSWLFGGIGAVITALSFSFIGHGTENPRLLMGGLVTAHILAASFWIGALAPLSIAAGGQISVQHAGRLAHRFGKQAAYTVSLLILAGLVLGYQLVGSVGVLFTSQYGITLILKLAVVGALLLLALVNKTKYVPPMLKGGRQGADRLRRSIFWEAIAFAIILVITAVLTTVTALPEMHSS